MRIRTVILSAIVALLGAAPATAQIDNIDNFIQGGLDDAQFLLESYLAPLGKGFGADLNNNWYNTARPHSFLGLDISVVASAAVAPVQDKSFDLNDLPLQHIRLLDPARGTQSPTVVGDDHSGPQVVVVVDNPLTGDEATLDTLTLPQGMGFRYVPAPMLQVAVGVFKNTEVMLRGFPEIKIGDDFGKLRVFGIGIKHDLLQWLPGGSTAPLDVSIMAGYTNLLARTDDLSISPVPTAVQTGATYTDQVLEVEAKSWTVNLLASKKLSILTLFCGLGYERSTMDIRLLGTYPIVAIEDDLASPNFGKTVIRDYGDPIALSLAGANRLRANAGLRMQLLFLALHASYTFASYPVVTAGIGLSIR